jgi:hypothetical protein
MSLPTSLSSGLISDSARGTSRARPDLELRSAAPISRGPLRSRHEHPAKCTGPSRFARASAPGDGIAVPNEFPAAAEAPFPRAKRDSRPSAQMHVRDGMQVFADWRESDRAWLLNA